MCVFGLLVSLLYMQVAPAEAFKELTGATTHPGTGLIL